MSEPTTACKFQLLNSDKILQPAVEYHIWHQRQFYLEKYTTGRVAENGSPPYMLVNHVPFSPAKNHTCFMTCTAETLKKYGDLILQAIKIIHFKKRSVSVI